MCRSLVKSIGLFAAVLLGCLVAQPAWAEYQFGKIALTGEIAPGSGGSGAEVPFTDFDDFILNDVGEVALIGQTSNNGNFAGDRGIFSTVGGSLHAEAFGGQIAPGSGGSGADMPFTGFLDLQFNAAGEVAFVGGTETTIGIFSTVGSVLHAEAIHGQIAPGSGGSGVDMPFSIFFNPTLNAAGKLVFPGAFLTNADGNVQGIFSTVGGVINPESLQGQIVPGSGGSGLDVPIAFSFPLSPVLNAVGEVAFRANTSTNADGGNSGIFSTVGGSLHTEAFAQQIAPGSGGSGADVPFTIFEEPALNTAGEVAFFASTTDNADFDRGGVFSTNGGALHAVAFSGQVAPGSGGSGADVEFDFSFPHFDEVALNDAGEMAFQARTETNADWGNSGIFSSAGGTLHAVAFEQQIAPGSGGSGADVPFEYFLIPQINSEGEVLFWAQTSPNTDGGNTDIFRSINGVLEKVFFEGDQIEVAPGEFRIVESLFAGHDQFNDMGQLAFGATFTDGSAGIFIATPVPEPSTAVLALMGVMGCCFSVSRKRLRTSGARC